MRYLMDTSLATNLKKKEGDKLPENSNSDFEYEKIMRYKRIQFDKIQRIELS
jgi:hypothetical protein